MKTLAWGPHDISIKSHSPLPGVPRDVVLPLLLRPQHHWDPRPRFLPPPFDISGLKSHTKDKTHQLPGTQHHHTTQARSQIPSPRGRKVDSGDIGCGRDEPRRN